MHLLLYLALAAIAAAAPGHPGHGGRDGFPSAERPVLTSPFPLHNSTFVASGTTLLAPPSSSNLADPLFAAALVEQTLPLTSNGLSVAGAVMIADILTKAQARPVFLQLLRHLHSYAATGVVSP